MAPIMVAFLISVIAPASTTPLAIVPDNHPIQSEPTLPFTPATSEETLIIIPLYDDRSEGGLQPGINPSSEIYDLTFKAANEHDKSQVRVEFYNEVVSTSAEAQALGEEYNAKMVLWGWYNSLKVQPYVELVGERTIQGAGMPIATPTPMAFYFLEEIPALAAYLGLYLMGMAHIITDSPDDLRQAIAFFSAALDAVVISTKTNPWEAYIWRANCHLWLNEHAKAVPDYNQGIRLNPEDASAHFNRGIVHGALGNHEEAIRDYTKAIEIDSQYMFAYIGRGYAYFIQEQYALAVDDLTMAIQLDPQYILAYKHRFNAYYALEKYDEAIADYQKALEIDGSLPDASPLRLHPDHREEMEQRISELE